jgi:hypothetical protein
MFDEFGRPVVVLREQAERERLTGLAAHKVGFLALWCFKGEGAAWALLRRAHVL